MKTAGSIGYAGISRIPSLPFFPLTILPRRGRDGGHSRGRGRQAGGNVAAHRQPAGYLSLDHHVAMNTFTHRIHHRPQAARRGRSEGFTLVEVIITILISGILFFTIGTLFLTTRKSWLKSSIKVAAKDDYRFARTLIDYVLRVSTENAWASNWPGPIGATRGVTVGNTAESQPPWGQWSAIGWDSTRQQLLLTHDTHSPDPRSRQVLMNNVTGFRLDETNRGINNYWTLVTLTINQWLPVEKSSRTYTITSFRRNIKKY